MVVCASEMGRWYLEKGSDNCIYLCCNGSRLQAPSGKGEVGFILDAKVQTHSSKTYIVVSCYLADQNTKIILQDILYICLVLATL